MREIPTQKNFKLWLLIGKDEIILFSLKMIITTGLKTLEPSSIILEIILKRGSQLLMSPVIGIV